MTVANSLILDASLADRDRPRRHRFTTDIVNAGRVSQTFIQLSSLLFSIKKPERGKKATSRNFGRCTVSSTLTTLSDPAIFSFISYWNRRFRCWNIFDTDNLFPFLFLSFIVAFIITVCLPWRNCKNLLKWKKSISVEEKCLSDVRNSSIIIDKRIRSISWTRRRF